jgi:hypothetical protein
LNANASTSTGNDVLLFGDTNLGRVSIGTKSPMAKLHITSTQSNVPLIIASGSTTAELVRITQTGTGNAFLVEDSNNPDTTAFVIDNSGSVGIGTIVPNAKLEVYGGILGTSSNSYLPSQIIRSVNATNPANVEYVEFGSLRTATGSDWLSAGFRIQEKIDSTWMSFMQFNGDGNHGGISFGTGQSLTSRQSIPTRMTIVQSGNVGIGVTGPSAKLHVTDTQTLTLPLIIASGSTTVDMVRITQRGTGNSLLVEDNTNPDSTPFVIDNIGNVGIGMTGPGAKLHVLGGTSSPVFKVDGTSGELFTIVDSLVGSLFSVNDISGLPIMEAFSDNTILLGDYQAPSLYTTKKAIVAVVTNFVVYQFVASLYTSVFFEYNVQNSTNLRAGTIMAVWNTNTIEFTENSTMDIGNTTPISFNVVLTTISTVVYVQLRATTTTTGWTIKSIIRSI